MKKSDLSSILGGRLKEHQVLRDFTTVKVGGVADYFWEAKTQEDLIRAVMAALKLKIPYFILGIGSNVVISDIGFPGLVILNHTANLSFIEEKSQVIVDSGVLLARLIMEAVSRDLGGLETLAGIPGTVGGAIYNNASAWGKAIGDYVKKLTLLLPTEGSKAKIVRYRRDWMKFGYHQSILKLNKKKNPSFPPVILSVLLQLAHNKKEEILRTIQHYQRWRAKNQPAGFSCGSVFLNPGNVAEQSAGYLIDHSGLKGLKVGRAVVSKKHANRDRASAPDIRMLAEKVRDEVTRQKGIILQEEIEYIGHW
jgi:UDP-N-acetylmuramate dehydrogenase